MDRVGLIEDDDFSRAVFVTCFNSAQVFDVVFSVSDVTDALLLTVEAPDLILLDVDLPSGCGIAQIPLLKQKFAKSKIVILSNLEEIEMTRLAIKHGATGYLLKSSSLDFITESLLKIAQGGSPFSPATITHLLCRHTNHPNHLECLTKRELQLVELLSQGLANKMVADKLQLSYFTVNNHLKSIYKKLHINSKSELISWYLGPEHLAD